MLVTKNKEKGKKPRTDRPNDDYMRSFGLVFVEAALFPSKFDKLSSKHVEVGVEAPSVSRFERGRGMESGEQGKGGNTPPTRVSSEGGVGGDGRRDGRRDGRP
jgi:hypothetical protein